MKSVLLPLMIACSLSSAADLKVTNSTGTGSDLQISVYRLFDPFGEVDKGVISGADHAAPLNFKELLPGEYSVVVWSSHNVWSVSPQFDITVSLGEKGQAIVIPPPTPPIKLVISVPRTAFSLIDEKFKGLTYVPCRIQRIEGKRCPSFGFRWINLLREGNDKLSTECSMEDGTYLFCIPFPAATEAWPPRKRGPEMLSPALFAFPISLSEGRKTFSLNAEGWSAEILSAPK